MNPRSLSHLVTVAGAVHATLVTAHVVSVTVYVGPTYTIHFLFFVIFSAFF
jgi:hypothetical protein